VPPRAVGWAGPIGGGWRRTAGMADIWRTGYDGHGRVAPGPIRCRQWREVDTIYIVTVWRSRWRSRLLWQELYLARSHSGLQLLRQNL